MHQKETSSKQEPFNFTDILYLDTNDPSTNTYEGQFNIGNVSNESRVNDINLVNSHTHRDYRSPSPHPNFVPTDPRFPVFDAPWSIYQPPRNEMVSRVQPRRFEMRNSEWNHPTTQPTTVHVHHKQVETTSPHVVHSNIQRATPHSMISHQAMRERRNVRRINHVARNNVPSQPSGFPILDVEEGHRPAHGMFRDTSPETCSVPSRHVVHPTYDRNVVYNTNAAHRTNVVHNTNVVQRINRQVIGRNRFIQGNTRKPNQVPTKYAKDLPPQEILDENFDALLQMGEDCFKELLNKICEDDSITPSSSQTKTIQVHNNQSEIQACKPEDQTPSKSHDIIPQVSDKRSNQQDKQQDSKDGEDDVTRKGGKRKPRTYAHAVPSQHCHICSRKPSAESPHVCCGNLMYGRCRKTVCKRCFSQFNWDITEAINAVPGSWKCPHCREECPSRAQCVIYNRTSDRRRKRTLDSRKRKVDEAGPSGVNVPAPKREQCGSNAPDPAAKEARAVDTPGQTQNDGELVTTSVQTEGTEPTCQTISQAGETYFPSGTNSSARTPENVETSVCQDQQRDSTHDPIPVSAENMINTLKSSSHIVGTTEQKEMLRHMMEDRMVSHCGLVESDTDMFPGISPEVDEGGQIWNKAPEELSTNSAYGTYSSNQKVVDNNTSSEEKEGMTDDMFVHPMLFGADSSLESDCLVSTMGNETKWDEGTHDILEKQLDTREDCEWISGWLNDDPDVSDSEHEFNHDSFLE